MVRFESISPITGRLMTWLWKTGGRGLYCTELERSRGWVQTSQAALSFIYSRWKDDAGKKNKIKCPDEVSGRNWEGEKLLFAWLRRTPGKLWGPTKSNKSAARCEITRIFIVWTAQQVVARELPELFASGRADNKKQMWAQNKAWVSQKTVEYL